MAKIKVNISASGCKDKLNADAKALIKQSCEAVLTVEEIFEKCEVNVTVVDEQRIKELNRDYRNVDKVTDVLSFPLCDDGEFDTNPENGNLLLGDVVICITKAKEQAAEYNHSVEREISFLTVHSMLHLLGYDHVGDEIEAECMRSKEKQVMEYLGIKR